MHKQVTSIWHTDADADASTQLGVSMKYRVFMLQQLREKDAPGGAVQKKSGGRKEEAYNH